LSSVAICALKLDFTGEREREREWLRFILIKIISLKSTGFFVLDDQTQEQGAKNSLCQRFNSNSKAWPEEKWQLKPQVLAHFPRHVIELWAFNSLNGSLTFDAIA
jgi:hypothetical protein